MSYWAIGNPRLRLICCCGIVLSTAGHAVAQEQPPAIQPPHRQAPPVLDSLPINPATAPATPTTQPTAAEIRDQMPRLFADLASADAAVREAARVTLMGLSRLDLPRFEKLVADNLPLQPAQATVLKEIVTHIYLAGEEYPAINRQGFLGVRFQEVNTVTKPDPEAPQGEAPGIDPDPNPFDPRRQFSTGPATTGILITERMPGFCGGRWLQDGDVLLGLLEKPGEPIRNTTDMRNTVTSFIAGQTIHFRLLRQGQVVNVPVTLDPKPEAAEPPNAGFNAMQNLIDQRRVRAQEYWDTAFGAKLKETAG